MWRHMLRDLKVVFGFGWFDLNLKTSIPYHFWELEDPTQNKSFLQTPLMVKMVGLLFVGISEKQDPDKNEAEFT